MRDPLYYFNCFWRCSRSYQSLPPRRINYWFLLSDTPCGQLPVLNYNGTEIGQSMTIARFLAKEFNLAGKNRVEEALADMIVDCMTDLVTGKRTKHILVRDQKLTRLVKICTTTYM